MKNQKSNNARKLGNFNLPISDLFNLTLQKLDLNLTNLSSMSTFQIYILQSPTALYLWLGEKVEKKLKNGALRIL